MKRINALEFNTLMWFLIRASFVSLTSNIVLSISGLDAWISIILGIILGILPFSLYNYLRNKFPSKNIITLNMEKLGKVGFIFNLIIISGVFVYGICSFWTLTHFIDSQFLYKTSSYIITTVLIIPVAYAVMQNIHVLGKVSLIMFYVVIGFISLILLGLASNVNIQNIKPILQSSPLNILYGALNFVAFNILTLFLLLIIPNEKIIYHSFKRNIIFYILACLSLLNVMFLTISIFGIDLATLYDYTGFHLLKRVSVLDVIDRVESILSLEWVLSLFVQTIMSLYFVKEAVREIFKQKQKANNIFALIICIFVSIICNVIFITHGTEDAYFEHILIYILYIVFLGIPFITFLKCLKES